MNRVARVIAAIALLFCGAQPSLADDAYVSLVPWRVLEEHAKVDSTLALYWIPAAADELRRSPMLTSDDLTLFSSQCVAMRVVRLSDHARVSLLAQESELPVAVLVDGEGEVLGRVEGAGGVLSVADVERLVGDELDRRAAESEAMLDRARERLEADDVEAAVALYRSVWETRCECPRQARVARKALRRLGR